MKMPASIKLLSVFMSIAVVVVSLPVYAFVIDLGRNADCICSDTFHIRVVSQQFDFFLS